VTIQFGLETAKVRVDVSLEKERASTGTTRKINSDLLPAKRDSNDTTYYSKLERSL
jgi:hypothetical protein